MDKKINVGCNTLIIKDQQILLGKRKNHSGEGTWELPGGHLKFGEDLIDGAKRELQEELGIINSNLSFLSITEGKKDKAAHYIQINFFLENFDGKFKLLEPEFCEEWKFFDLNNLPEVFPPHKNILKSLGEKKTYIHD